MNASMYPCHTDKDKPKWEQPRWTVRKDDDGDIVLSFDEPPSNITVVMNQEQFLNFLRMAEVMRDELVAQEATA